MILVALLVLTAAYLAVMIILLARRKPGYSHFKHSISELGEVSAPDQKLVALGLFLPVGLVLLVAAGWLRITSEPIAALSAAMAAGYLVAAFFPCDVGSPMVGTWRQAVHNLGGAVQYAGGGFALLRIAEALGQPFRAGGAVVLGAVVGLSVLSANSFRGLVQRVAEVVLFGLLAYGMWRLEGAA